MRYVLTLVALVVIAAIGCGGTDEPPSPTPRPTSTPRPTPTPAPSPEIVGRSTTELGGLFADYTIQVHCTVRNNGSTGQMTVLAELDGLGGAWTKRDSSVVGSNEERLFTFDFPEVETQLFGDNSYTYNCAVRVP